MKFNTKFIVNNPKEEQIYNLYLNINSDIHGIISSKPLIIQALIYPENLKGRDLFQYLDTYFEIDLKDNNISIYDIEGKNIDMKKYLDTPSSLPADEEEKDVDHYHRYVLDKIKINKNNNSEVYSNKIKEEINKYLSKNKNVKISKDKIKKIIDRLNVEYFASLWMEIQKLLDIIVQNNGKYKEIAQIVEDLL